jgi:hypothetical protein
MMSTISRVQPERNRITAVVDPLRDAECRRIYVCMTNDERFYEQTISVECPLCLASPGRPCVDPRGETTNRHGQIVRTHARRVRRSLRKAAAS